MRKRNQFFHEGSPYFIETSPLIKRVNQYTGFFTIGSSAMKELTTFRRFTES